MIRGRTVFISLSSIAALGSALFYSNHLRLISLYPTLPVPPQLLISRRTDSPHTTERWMRCDGGDAWSIKIPKSILISSYKEREEEQEMDIQKLGARWNKAFWSNWALRLEGGLFGLIRPLITPKWENPNEMNVFKENFGKGNTLLNGLFTVEAIDPTPDQNSHNGGNDHSEMIFRWGDLTPDVKSNLLFRGGYHTLSARTTSSFRPQEVQGRDIAKSRDQGKNEDVYLIFTCQGVYRSLPPPKQSSHSRVVNNGDCPGSGTVLEGMNFVDKLFSAFHREYARILIDLAIRNMGLQGKGVRVDKWPSESSN
ncbi:uncharacterized protein IL334_006091 [Kwoniella shivajii]|uniref:Uncharacterized protein n=1 Tax=Kwoniella shivajii TaxID=564305 RepID=A0ABZ1D680_9TREE|nr:hypothetical protein IL334_006091 [Kwoniella shivajii]